ncbi:hypothetical protein [Streptomyces sp. NPDC001435]
MGAQLDHVDTRELNAKLAAAEDALAAAREAGRRMMRYVKIGQQ